MSGAKFALAARHGYFSRPLLLSDIATISFNSPPTGETKDVKLNFKVFFFSTREVAHTRSLASRLYLFSFHPQIAKLLHLVKYCYTSFARFPSFFFFATPKKAKFFSRLTKARGNNKMRNSQMENRGSAHCDHASFWKTAASDTNFS